MARSDALSETETEQPLARPENTKTDAGRMGVYTAGAALAGMLPIPWIPDSVERRIRGSLVYEIAARHGVSLAPEAREVLAEGSRAGKKRGVLRQVAGFFGFKMLTRLGPIGILPPVKAAVTTFALAHLFERYLETIRSDKSIRIDLGEARAVRYAIDASIVHALSVEGKKAERAVAPEELRDVTTQMIDGILGTVAALPSWLVARLDAAFDELAPRSRG